MFVRCVNFTFHLYSKNVLENRALQTKIAHWARNVIRSWLGVSGRQ